MTYYFSKAFWLLAAPTSALVLISAIGAFWAVFGSSKGGAWLAAAAACGLVIGAFTPIGLALTVPLENRFSFSPPDPQTPPDGIVILAGGSSDRIKGGVNILWGGYQRQWDDTQDWWRATFDFIATI